MKLRINRDTLMALPAPVRSEVEEWKQRYRKAHFNLEAAERFTIEEDARYTAFSADMGRTVAARAAGEWAGASGLRPGASCDLPQGCTVVATGIFCGLPWLTIYHNPNSAERVELVEAQQQTTITEA